MTAKAKRLSAFQRHLSRSAAVFRPWLTASQSPSAPGLASSSGRATSWTLRGLRPASYRNRSMTAHFDHTHHTDQGDTYVSSHAKAPSAGSNQRQATSLGRFVRGADATRASANGSGGSGAPSGRRLAALLTAIAALALLAFAPAASAATKTTIGVLSGSANFGHLGGEFSNPRGSAVNRTGNGGVAAGSLYVVDGGNNRVEAFKPNGEFERAFGSNVGGSGVNICTVGPNCAAGTSGTAAGQFASAQGIAIDQSNGNVYVSDSGNRRIDVYSATGTFQGAFGWGAVDGTAAFQYCTTTCHAPGTTAPSTGNVPGGQFGATIGGLAVDSSGKVYVADGFNRRVDVFTPTIVSGVVTAVEFTKAFGWGAENGNAEYQVCNAPTVCHAPAAAGTGLGQFEASSPSFIALDSSGNLYALDAPNKRVEKFDTTPAPIASPTFDASAAITAAFGSGSLYGLDFDPAGNHLYVAGSNSVSNPANQVRVAEMSASGAAVAVHGTDLTIAGANGLAVAPASLGGSLFLTSEYGGKSRVYVLNEAPVANPVTTYTATTATFTGTVVSNSSPVTYQFEYSADNGAHWTKAPASAVSVPATVGTVAVSQSVTGLSPFQPYKVRLVQTMPVSGFTATSPEVSFTTRGPILSGTAILWPSVTLTSATVRAEVNPNGEGTSYRFEYVTAAQFEASGFAGASVAPTGVAGVGHGSSPVPVTQQLSGLSPATTYYFRVAATNNAATAVGPELTFNTFSTQPSFSGCANESLRTAGPVGGLPDCRAYEQASPADKHGGAAEWGKSGSVVEASATGNAVTFGDAAGLPVSGGLSGTGGIYLASRSGGTWSTDGLLPPTEPGSEATTFGWNEDLSTSAATVNGEFDPAAAGLYLRDSATATMQPVVTGYGYFEGYVTGFAGNSSRLLFESPQELASGAIAEKPNAYELSEGIVSLVGRVPAHPATERSCDDEAGPPCVSPASGSFPGPYSWFNESPSLTLGGSRNQYLTQGQGAISRDGSRAFFTEAGNSGERLYVREDGERTTEVSAPNTGVSDANGEKAAAFLAATPDGSEALFLSCQKLTADSTAVSTAAKRTCSKISEQGQDLYAYDAKAPAGERLTDLSVDHTAGDAKGAQVIGFLGMSEDGSDAYFAANGVLAPGATPGNCTINTNSPSNGECSLYLVHLEEGGAPALSFVARLEANGGSGQTKDFLDWMATGTDNSSRPKSARVSASGALLFSSTRKLTAYDNHGFAELYRYVPGEAAPTCVSCDPTGAPPVGEAALKPHEAFNQIVAAHQNMPFLTRNISANGERVFFETPDKLVPADVNGEGGCPLVKSEITTVSFFSCVDVYEWEAPGAPGGECHEGGSAYSPQDGGCLYLISTGTNSEFSLFGDADAEGNNVFFFTGQSLVPQDKDQLTDVYDASVGGGLASQHPAPEPPSCEGEACRGAGGAAVSGPGAGTAVFQGPGNPAAKPKPKKHRPKKHRKHHHAKRSHRRAHGDRGGSK